MVFKKTFDTLNNFFQENNANKKYNDNMKKVLEQLEKKAQGLNTELLTEKNERIRNDINLTLIVIAKQREKGEKFLQENKNHSARIKPVVYKVKLSP